MSPLYVLNQQCYEMFCNTTHLDESERTNFSFWSCMCRWGCMFTKWIKVPFLCFSEPKKMALTESLCTQSIQASGPALLAQASGTVQIMAYLISPMVCLIPPHLHLSIIVWMIWPLPTTTGTHTDTPITGTSGTETDLWVRHVDFLHCFF